MTSLDLKPQIDSEPDIRTGSKFDSFKQFELAFERWKATHWHPFRVASSETLRMPDGSANETFKYRYIVYHCAHYGTPRMRGIGKRPNQNYMPCGCRAMLRLNFSWTENSLRVTTLHAQHSGHQLSSESYCKFASKTKRYSYPLPKAHTENDDKKIVQEIENVQPEDLRKHRETRGSFNSPLYDPNGSKKVPAEKNENFSPNLHNSYPQTPLLALNFNSVALELARARLNLQKIYPNGILAYPGGNLVNFGSEHRLNLIYPAIKDFTDFSIKLKSEDFERLLMEFKIFIEIWRAKFDGKSI